MGDDGMEMYDDDMKLMKLKVKPPEMKLNEPFPHSIETIAMELLFQHCMENMVNNWDDQ